MMTSSKAIAGGVGTAVGVVIQWALTLIPGWSTIPDEPRGALLFLVVTGIGAGITWLAPANAVKQTRQETS